MWIVQIVVLNQIVGFEMHVDMTISFNNTAEIRIPKSENTAHGSMAAKSGNHAPVCSPIFGWHMESKSLTVFSYIISTSLKICLSISSDIAIFHFYI